MAKKYSMTVEFPPVVVWVSRATEPAPDFQTPIEYSEFKPEPRLRVLDLFFGSSIGGQSYAKLELATGEPVTEQIDPENADQVLSTGDRIAIGFQETNNVRWRFAGYVVTSAILIQDDNERLTYKVIGPEWPLGDPSAPGCNALVAGQIRRGGTADDAWSKATSKVSQYADLVTLVDARCVFNEGGHSNMSKQNVVLTPPGKTQIKGRIFEEPDRRIKGNSVTERWNVLEAVKLLSLHYNRPEVTSIHFPKKWEKPIVPFSSEDALRPSDPDGAEVDADGVGLWAAITRVIHPRFAFTVDPTPTKINGKDWGTFNCYFFGRGQIEPESIPQADLHLNPRGTPMTKAIPSVSRMEAARDTAKIVNRMVVVGRCVQHVRLVFWGGATPKVTDKKKSVALQASWNNAVDRLNDYSGNDDSGGVGVITLGTVDKDATTRAKWRDRYVITGKDFTAHDDAFRRFVWNEAGEYDGLTPAYQFNASLLPTFRPDISKIVSDVQAEFRYVRRRRPVMDCAFLPVSAADEWQKKPATVYFAIAKNALDQNFPGWLWKRISTSYYDLDPLRAGFRITVDDLADWRPFHKADRDGDDPADQTPEDMRTFATLLNTGVLRMCLEGTIEMDTPLTAYAEPGTFSGTPHVRQHFVRGGNSFIKSFVFNDGFASPSKLAPAVIDRGDEAQKFADTMRDAGEQQSVHASITVEGDWPMQLIGSVIKEIKGRKIVLASNADGGRGAQIVAIRLDVQNGYWEYLTESAAMALHEKDRRRFESGTRIYAGEQKRKEYRA